MNKQQKISPNSTAVSNRCMDDLAFMAIPRVDGFNLDVWVHIASFFQEFGAYRAMMTTCRVNREFWWKLIQYVSVILG
jgi:hypothetical protein